MSAVERLRVTQQVPGTAQQGRAHLSPALSHPPLGTGTGRRGWAHSAWCWACAGAGMLSTVREPWQLQSQPTPLPANKCEPLTLRISLSDRLPINGISQQNVSISTWF